MFKSLGAAAVFDVAFGAELTVKSYLEHSSTSEPATIIAQPCPALVTFIELYHPELIQYLAPADSPMLHTGKMVKHFYPEYRDAAVVVLSPCYAKRREFDEVGGLFYNLAFKSIERWFKAKRKKLGEYPETEYDGDRAERAVLFSSPGGLIRTAVREVPALGEKTRRIEGPRTVYECLSRLGRYSLPRGLPVLRTGLQRRTRHAHRRPALGQGRRLRGTTERRGRARIRP